MASSVLLAEVTSARGGLLDCCVLSDCCARASILPQRSLNLGSGVGEYVVAAPTHRTPRKHVVYDGDTNESHMTTSQLMPAMRGCVCARSCLHSSSVRVFCSTAWQQCGTAKHNAQEYPPPSVSVIRNASYTFIRAVRQ